VFNTWLGDPSKVILLEELVSAIRDLKLLENAKSTGAAVVSGMKTLQVLFVVFALYISYLAVNVAHAAFARARAQKRQCYACLRTVRFKKKTSFL
jgi:hypothetical protein